MKKHIIKVLTIVLTLSFMLANVSLAIDFGEADNFLNYGAENPGIDEQGITSVGGEFTKIGNVLKYIGAGIMVGAMGYMGILYMISVPEKQAKLKQQLIGLVVAGFVIFGGYYIWQIIVELFGEVFGKV